LINQTKYTLVDFNGNSNLMQGYAQMKHKFRENLTVNFGAHYLYYHLNERQSLEPRASLSWKFIPKQSLSIGYGRHSKLLPPGVYFGESIDDNGDKYTPNKNLDFVKTDHFVLGYDFLITENLRLKFETYYQNIISAPVLADTAASFSGLNMGADYENIVITTPLSNNGTGENYGLEMTFERFLSKGFYFLLTGSLYESKYVGSDGIKRNTVFNGNYAYNILIGKEFEVGKNNNSTLGFNLTVVNIGGKRMTPIDLKESQSAGRTIRIDSLAFTEKLDPYFRTDLRLSYRQNRKKFSHELALEAKNMFDTKNVFLHYYNSSTKEITTLYQMGFFPIAIYRFEF